MSRILLLFRVFFFRDFALPQIALGQIIVPLASTMTELPPPASQRVPARIPLKDAPRRACLLTTAIIEHEVTTIATVRLQRQRPPIFGVIPCDRERQAGRLIEQRVLADAVVIGIIPIGAPMKLLRHAASVAYRAHRPITASQG